MGRSIRPTGALGGTSGVSARKCLEPRGPDPVPRTHRKPHLALLTVGPQNLASAFSTHAVPRLLSSSIGSVPRSLLLRTPWIAFQRACGLIPGYLPCPPRRLDRTISALTSRACSLRRLIYFCSPLFAPVVVVAVSPLLLVCLYLYP